MRREQTNPGCARCRAPLPVLFTCTVTDSGGETTTEGYCRPCIASLREEGYRVAVDTTDRDTRYADAYAPVTDEQLRPFSDWLAPWHLDELRKLVQVQRREAFLKGWHQGQCERDEDEEEGRCGECNADVANGEPHGSWCCEGGTFTGYVADEEDATDPRDYAGEEGPDEGSEEDAAS